MLTDNPVLVRRHKELPAIMCAQRRAEKKVVTEDDVIAANIASFGNDIGRTTNWVTSMFEVQSHFEEDSEEYKELDYRIKCGQLYQQNVIDKAKGIIAKPMPREWYDRHAVNKIEDEDKRRFYRSIVADKKPYFMRYIYPALSRQYNTYIKNTNRNALREFRMTVDELEALPADQLTERQSDFLRYCRVRMPVGLGDCVMNRICRRFEEAFDGYIKRAFKEIAFDYTIMKGDAEYTKSQASAIKKIYEDYNARLQSYIVYAHYDKVDRDESNATISAMRDEFVQECVSLCPDSKVLCNIILDLCYKRSTSKKFAWDICCEQIVTNLLAKNQWQISAPVYDRDGDIEYCGKMFRLITKRMEDLYEYHSE